MEKIINDIILFDKECEKYKKEKEEEIKLENERFEKSLKDIIEKEQRLLEIEKNEIMLKYDKILEEETFNIEKQNKEELEKLSILFDKIKLKASKEIFKSLIDLRN